MIKKNVYTNIAEILYLLLIGFFCYTAINKLMNLESFRINLMKTSLFSEAVAKYFSVFVIFSEIVVILIMVFYKKIGLLFLSIMILIFTFYISFLNFNGLYEVCGCGGILNGLSYKYHLTINIFLCVSTIYSFVIFNSKTNEK